MRRALLLLLILPFAAAAQEDIVPAEDVWEDEDWDDWEEPGTASSWSGFVEGGIGYRLSGDPLIEDDATLAELRARIEREWAPGAATISAKLDIGYDAAVSEAIAEFRDLTLAFSVGDATDFRIGRQVQTWGVGDLLFLNDLFPKDYVSFFSGRDDEYLKGPGNSARVTYYNSLVNADLVWTPRFEPDVYLTGERFSFFSPLAGAQVAPDPPLDAKEPDDGEFALRLFRSVEGTEYAGYFYRGYFKQPSALTPDFEPRFAKLGVIGASVRRPFWSGLFSGEVAWYDSREDGDGDDPLVPNSQFRVLAGYEWEAITNLTVGLQYYVEATLDHDELLANSPAPETEPEKYRQVLTNRLTWRLARDKYTLSLFTFYSPTDNDFYLRPNITWRYSDRWQIVGGANLFGGDDAHTFFNQLQDASNAYLRIRLNY